MFDFFGQIVGYFETAWEFFSNFLKVLTNGFTVMHTSIGFTISSLAYMPAIIGTAVAITLAIFVIKFILGR